MAVRVAINGFGRIGRLVLRAIMESGRKDIEVVGINDLGPVETNAHLFRHDTVHGAYQTHEVKTKADGMDVGAGFIKITAERDPAKLPWKDLKVDIALECTGIFTDKAKASAHLTAGAKRVLISAPSADPDLTVVLGVNHDKLQASHTVVSNASCTTNCLAPVVHVLNNAFGIERGYMTTIHSYTGDQPTLDTLHKDLYRARAAALNMIPTSTGAAKAIGLVIPALNGKLDGSSIRVPTPNVSLVDFKFTTPKPITKEQINDAIKAAAAGPLKGILGTNDEPLVSMDFNHNPASSTFDLKQTQVIDGVFCRVMTWYDNEWGFSNRMADVAVLMGKLGLKTVVVSNFPQARAALDAARVAGEGIALASPPDAAIQAGVLFYVKLSEQLAAEYPELKPVIAVDCGDRADLAHDAMRFGLKSIVFRGDPRTAEKLADIAGTLGVKFESHPA